MSHTTKNEETTAVSAVSTTNYCEYVNLVILVTPVFKKIIF